VIAGELAQRLKQNERTGGTLTAEIPAMIAEITAEAEAGALAEPAEPAAPAQPARGEEPT
jgi:hypothetical protein